MNNEKIKEFMQKFVYPVNPNFKIRNKSEPDLFYRCISTIIKLFNKNMDKNYITILNGNCWFPGSWFDKDGNINVDEKKLITILMHEMVHDRDRINLGNILFNFLYLMPQVLSVVGIFGIIYYFIFGNPLIIFFILFALPWPSIQRTVIEIRGYRINAAIIKLEYGNKTALEYTKSIIDKQFQSSKYYWMMPLFSNLVEKEIMNFSKLDKFHIEMIKWYSDMFNLNFNNLK